MSVQLARRQFSVEDFYRMAEVGIFSEDDHVELIEGEIIEMSPIGSRHSACVNRTADFLSRHKSQDIIISIQNPLRLNDFSEPEPDIALLRFREDFYAPSHPTPADVILIIEVAETSVIYDREIKLPLYARSGIAEVWFVNLVEETITIFSEAVNGKYQKAVKVRRGESFRAQAFPNIELSVNSILG